MDGRKSWSAKEDLKLSIRRLSQLLDSMHPINWHHVAHAGPMTLEQRHNKTCPTRTLDGNVGTARNCRMKLLQPLLAMLKPRNDYMIYTYTLFDSMTQNPRSVCNSSNTLKRYFFKKKHEHMTRNHETRTCTDARNSQHYRQHQGWTKQYQGTSSCNHHALAVELWKNGRSHCGFCIQPFNIS